ncbi:PadR family transcriptional regulator [Peptoniphilaceae bacterium SGI.097]
MKDRLSKKYIPMSETAFYILFFLQEPQHGYGIGQKVEEISNSEVNIGAGTMYGTLSKMRKDGLIKLLEKEDNRKIYQITDLGQEVLEIEIKRIDRLYKNSRGERYYG